MCKAINKSSACLWSFTPLPHFLLHKLRRHKFNQFMTNTYHTRVCDHFHLHPHLLKAPEDLTAMNQISRAFTVLLPIISPPLHSKMPFPNHNSQHTQGVFQGELKPVTNPAHNICLGTPAKNFLLGLVPQYNLNNPFRFFFSLLHPLHCFEGDFASGSLKSEKHPRVSLGGKKKPNSDTNTNKHSGKNRQEVRKAPFVTRLSVSVASSSGF